MFGGFGEAHGQPREARRAETGNAMTRVSARSWVPVVGGADSAGDTALLRFFCVGGRCGVKPRLGAARELPARRADGRKRRLALAI